MSANDGSIYVVNQVISGVVLSGIVLQTEQLNNLTSTLEVDVSSLAGGMYIIKFRQGESVMHRQFVKL